MSTERQYRFRPPVFARGHTVTGTDRTTAEFDDRLYTVPEALGVLRVGRTHLYKLIAQGHIRPLRLGHRTLIPRSEVSRLIREATGR